MGRRLSLTVIGLLLLRFPGQAHLDAQRQTAAERALDEQRRARNGIVVGQPKVYDDALLQQMLNDAEARLATLQVIDHAGLISKFGTTAGANQRTSAFAVNVQGPALPQVVTTNKGATGSTVDTKTTSLSTDNKPSSSEVVAATTGQNATDVVTTAPQATPPPAPVTAPAGAFPSSFSVSASDLLHEQMQLTFEIANLRLLLEGALSDRLFQNPKMQKIKPRTTIGVPITIESDRRYKNAVAVVEVEIERLNTLDENEQPAVTAVLPRDKTYNVAEITDSTTSIGGGVVTQLVGVSGSWLRGHKTYYMTQDQDTLGLTFAPTRQNAVGVSWQFRPVLGREYVRSGLKETFAQVAFPSAITEDFYGHAHVRTYWRKFDPKRGILGDIVGKSLEDNVVDWKIPRLPLEIPPSDFVSSQLTDLGGGQMLVNVPGPFLTGTYVRIGPALYQPGSPNATFELNGIRIVAPISELATKGAVLVARNGQEVPLILHRKEKPADPEVSLPAIDSATVTAFDDTRSVLTVKFKSKIDTVKPEPILVIGGHVLGYSDAPIERTDNTLRAIVTTAFITANPEVTATALFAPASYGARAVAQGGSMLSQGDRLVVLEQKKDSARFLLYGNRLDTASVILPSGVTLDKIGDAGDSDTLRVVSLTAEQLGLQKQLVLQRGTGRPSFVAIPALEFKAAKDPNPPTARDRVTVGADEAVFAGDNLKELVRVTFNGRALAFALAPDAKSVRLRGLKAAGVTAAATSQRLELYFKAPSTDVKLDVVSSKIETVVR